jgi:hypothetical protein
MASPPRRQETGKNGRGDGEPVRSELLREVNERIREVGREGDRWPEGLEFMCECGNGGCEAMVELSANAYDGIRQEEGLVLAAGHSRA